MAYADGASEEAGGPAQVAGTGVSDIIIATDGLVSLQGQRAGGCAAHYTVSAVGLVCHAGVGAGADHIGAGLFALSLVHDLEVRVTFAAGHQKSTLVFVGVPVTPADSMLSGDVGTVWGANALRTSSLHLAYLPRATLHSLTRLFAGPAGDDAQEAQETDLVDGQASVGPGCVQAAAGAALLPAHFTHEHHVTTLILLQPTHARTGLVFSENFT